MKTIEGFNKSDHFNYRQWDRNITDELLNHVLKDLKPKPNTLYIISRNILKKFNRKIDKELFIKVERNTLVTCFYCEFQHYQGSRRQQNYLIINKI